MFKFIFYFFGVIAIIYEFWSLGKENQEEVEKFQKLVKNTPKNELFEVMTPTQAGFVVLQVLYFMWVLVGLFTSQWFMFLALLGLSLAKHWLKGREWDTIDAVISIGILLFTILNAYHFHIVPF